MAAELRTLARRDPRGRRGRLQPAHGRGRSRHARRSKPCASSSSSPRSPSIAAASSSHRATARWSSSPAWSMRFSARSRSSKPSSCTTRSSRPRALEFRVGINLGDVIIDGDDIYGDGVNVAARLEGRPRPAGSASRISSIRWSRPLNLAFEDMGEQHVKNIAQPVRVWRCAFDDRAAQRPASGKAAITVSAVPERPSIAVCRSRTLPGTGSGLFQRRPGRRPDHRSLAALGPSCPRGKKCSIQGADSATPGRSRRTSACATCSGGAFGARANRIRINAQLIDATTAFTLGATLRP